MSEPVTDDTINALVKIVEAAEVMAKQENISVSLATRFILKASQIATQLAAASSLTNVPKVTH